MDIQTLITQLMIATLIGIVLFVIVDHKSYKHAGYKRMAIIPYLISISDSYWSIENPRAVLDRVAKMTGYRWFGEIMTYPWQYRIHLWTTDEQGEIVIEFPYIDRKGWLCPYHNNPIVFFKKGTLRCGERIKILKAIAKNLRKETKCK